MPNQKVLRFCAVFALVCEVFALACGTKSEPKPLDVQGQKTYVVKGTVVSRSEADNTLRLDHEAIPGFMEAMTMDYSVRGEKVGELPANGARVVATLHAAGDAYWLTNVKKGP